MTSIASPAQNFIANHQWLVGDGSPVAALRADGPDTVAVIVHDPEAEPDYKVDADHWMVDNASVVLADTVDGVKLLPQGVDGYIGQDQGFSSDELYFLWQMPRADYAGHLMHDVNGDGKVGEEESAHVFEMASQADIDAVDPLIIDEINDVPVAYVRTSDE